MKNILFLLLPALVPAIAASSCHPLPKPDAGAGGMVATGGTSSTGGDLATGGSSATPTTIGVGGSVTIVWPECMPGFKAAPAVKHKLGWKRNPLRHAKGFKFAAPEVGTAVSVFHDPNLLKSLDQGNIGSCTGNSLLQAICTRPFTRTDCPESLALSIYSAATKLDNGCSYDAKTCPGSYPPNDTGSTTSSAMIAAQDLGLIVSWMPVANFDDLLLKLKTRACTIGINWHTDSDSPACDGKIGIGGAIRGGHALEAIGANVEQKRLYIRNSWGPWGANRKGSSGVEDGFAYFSFDDARQLIDNEQGEADCANPN